MVRLVFRPYTQVRRSNCTSESLRSSRKVSLPFNLLRNSSPSFGSHRIRSASTTLQAVGRAVLLCFSIHCCRSHTIHFRCASEFQLSLTRACGKLLGPCFKTGRMGDRLSHRVQRRPYEGGQVRQVGHASDRYQPQTNPDGGTQLFFNCNRHSTVSRRSTAPKH